MRLDTPFAVVQTPTGPAVVPEPKLALGGSPDGGWAALAWVPALTPDRLGDPTFLSQFGLRYAYVAGAMANGIATTDLCIAMAHAGMIGFFGAAGLPTARIAEAIDRLQAALPDAPFGADLIHSPADPRQEQETADLYVQRGVTIAGASAFMGLTPAIVSYRLRGVARSLDGRILPRHRVFAKVSRPEVADRFLRPAPDRILDALVDAGRLTAEEAALGRSLPMCDAIVAEGDSGGHTDQRPLGVLVPLLTSLRDRVAKETGRGGEIPIGAGGGIGCPAAVASAFALGAAFVVVGSVHQACIESGTSAMVRAMLADADMADVGLAPASDMFEQGASVQVLQRGTLYPMRARQLHAVWRAYDAWEAIPAEERARIESGLLRASFDDVWGRCVDYFSRRDPSQLARAEADPRHRMALVFRWYLGQSSRWAIDGDTERRVDAQVWCGPAIGAFNAWTRGTWLADPGQRRAVDVAANLMAGAAAIARAHILRSQGVDPGPAAFDPRPRPVRPHRESRHAP